MIIKKLRDPVSGLTHLFAALAALVGLDLINRCKIRFLETNFVINLRFFINPNVCGERGLSSAKGAATGDPLAAQARSFSNLFTDCRDLYTDLLEHV